MKQDIYLPRIHVASIETCGCVADFDRVTRQAHRLHDDAGAARDSHRGGAGGRARRAVRGEDPHHLARHRRRLRRQGAGLSGLRDRHRRVGRHRQAGQVDRGSDGEPPGRLLRPRLPHEGGARGEEGRHDDGASDQDRRRPRLCRRRGQPVEVPGRPLLDLHRLVRPEARVRRGGRRLHEQAARRHRLPLLVPRHRSGARDRADGRRAGAGAQDGSGRAADEELHPGRQVPVPAPRSAGSTTAATTRRR